MGPKRALAHPLTSQKESGQKGTKKRQKIGKIHWKLWTFTTISRVFKIFIILITKIFHHQWPLLSASVILMGQHCILLVSTSCYSKLLNSSLTKHNCWHTHDWLTGWSSSRLKCTLGNQHNPITGRRCVWCTQQVRLTSTELNNDLTHALIS